MTDPNFMIIGAQKAGTSWLAKAISQHPDIFIPKSKEIHFFNHLNNFEKGIDWYRGQFSDLNAEKMIGDATPNYFWTTPGRPEIAGARLHENIPGTIHSFYPGIKIIISLRNPVDRAVSAYFHHIKYGRISPSDRLIDVCGRFGMFTMGLYSVHLEKWAEYFDIEEMKILIFEKEIRKNRMETLRSVFQYLEVPDDFVPENISDKRNKKSPGLCLRAHNISRGLGSFLEKIPVVSQIDFPPVRVGREDYESLLDQFMPDIERLEKMLDIDLDIWKTPPPQVGGK